MTLLLEMRDAIKLCANIDLRLALRDSADDLNGAIIAFINEQSDETLRRLNGQWSRSVAVLNKFHEPPAPAPVSGGLEEGALLQVAA